MPNFKAGSHDRVFSAQLNGAVALTDPTTLLAKEYKDNTNILFYDLDHIEAVTEKVDQSLNEIINLKKIAQNGFDIAKSKHTWANIANVLIKAIH